MFKGCAAHHEAKRVSDEHGVLVDHDRGAHGAARSQVEERLFEDDDRRGHDVHGVDVEEHFACLLLEGTRVGPRERPRQEHLAPSAPNVEQARARVQMEQPQKPRSGCWRVRIHRRSAYLVDLGKG